MSTGLIIIGGVAAFLALTLLVGIVLGKRLKRLAPGDAEIMFVESTGRITSILCRDDRQLDRLRTIVASRIHREYQGIRAPDQPCVTPTTTP